ncbi:uncharacterized protein DUF2726 [Paraburkholderia sp. BL23I1N1]|uniref:DUF2726 domain-containing protein n=1 Tax=Paraburkholderia sp. BL23I1N1 TaxID=1938802 RepID=UPI000FED3AF7|nr:DUF2726 domain-containing protein [Paraburkholderia sp. BL23I1N1]RKE25256.1 uncharacterized protein DUF2726 [Paraburkholderia sp. BL23I1N1]
MTRKSKARRDQAKLKKPVTSPAHGTASATAGGFNEPRASTEDPFGIQTVADLKNNTRMCVEAGDWDSLLRLADTPPEYILDADEVTARLWLLRTRICAFTKGQPGSASSLSGECRDEAKAAVTELSKGCADFPKLPEFALFVRLLGHEFDEVLYGFEVLADACKEPLEFFWIERFRSVCHRLMFLEEYVNEDGEEIPQAHYAARERLPEIDLVLAQAYVRAEEIPDLGTGNLARLRAFQAELLMQMAEQAEADAVRAALSRIPAPVIADPDDDQGEDEGWSREEMSANDWGFLWELSWQSFGGYADLLGRYPGPYENDLCEGLANLIKSALANGKGRAAQLFSAGVHSLARFQTGLGSMLGASLTVGTPEGGRTEVPIAYQNLRHPSAESLVQRLVDHIPSTYSHNRELCQFSRLFAGAMSYYGNERHNPGEDTTYEAVESIRDTTSALFQWMAIDGWESLAERIKFFVGALMHPYASTQIREHYSLPVLQGDVPADKVRAVLGVLTEFAGCRHKLEPHPHLDSLWKQSAVRIFDALMSADGEDQSDLLWLARELAEDLMSPRGTFLLAYLEQVAGDKQVALATYLDSLALSEKASDVLLTNAKLLWANETELVAVQAFVETLRSSTGGEAHVKAAVKDLLNSAEQRLKTLRTQDQFERTAVTRWPSLTWQAKNVLMALNQIDSFNGFEELGKYAGMTAYWAQHHHRKLMSDGMLFERDGRYQINPHILPLLERENQHAVAGRIVRTQGTSAVKQVFNSQREFSIYQVVVQLCPNHLVFPNCSLQSIMSYDRMKELVESEDFGYYLRASVDIVVVSSTTYLPLLAIEVDSPWHDTEKQQERDDRKDGLFAVAGIPFLRLRPFGRPTPAVIRGEVSAHLAELISMVRTDMPGYDQARHLIDDLAKTETPADDCASLG